MTLCAAARIAFVQAAPQGDSLLRIRLDIHLCQALPYIGKQEPEGIVPFTAGQAGGHALDGFTRLKDFKYLFEVEFPYGKTFIGLMLQEAVGGQFPEKLPDGRAAQSIGRAQFSLDQPLPRLKFFLDDLLLDVFVNRFLIFHGLYCIPAVLYCQYFC